MSRQLREGGVNPGSEMMSRREAIKRLASIGLVAATTPAAIEAVKTFTGFTDAVEARRRVTPERMTPELAARRFGVILRDQNGDIIDDYSTQVSSWEINDDGGAHMKDAPDGKVHRVRLQTTINGRPRKAVAEGWYPIEKDGTEAQTFVADPQDVKFVEAVGLTLWLAPEGKEKALWYQVRDELIPKLRDRDSSVRVITMGRPIIEHRPVFPISITVEEAAARWGKDYWTGNSENWIYINGGVQVLEDPSGKEHEVTAGDGAIWVAWNKVPRPEGARFDAQTLVACDDKGFFIKAGSLYVFKEIDKRAGHAKLYEETVRRERRQQPGTLVIPVFN